jgi:hypothetical protein
MVLFSANADTGTDDLGQYARARRSGSECAASNAAGLVLTFDRIGMNAALLALGDDAIRYDANAGAIDGYSAHNLDPRDHRGHCYLVLFLKPIPATGAEFHNWVRCIPQAHRVIGGSSFYILLNGVSTVMIFG